jgi:hypothetical protein
MTHGQLPAGHSLDDYTAVRCPTPMVHRDQSRARCVLPVSHLLDDSDHQDEHGCTAPVLIHQSTIREVERWSKISLPE